MDRAREPGRGARILLIRLSALGDVVFALEALASLKKDRPDLFVDFLVEDRFASLLDGHPQIERLLVFPRRQKGGIPSCLRELRRTAYDAVLDFHGILKSAFFVLAARSSRKVGYEKPGSREGARAFYGVRVPMPDRLPHRADMGYSLLRAIGLSGERAAPVLALPALERDPFEGMPHPRVVLHPGTSPFARFKRWPLERYSELARRLIARGYSVAVGTGPGEAEAGKRIAASAPGIAMLDGQAMGLRGYAAALARADLVVAADTGPLHLAAASGVRCVALYGPKDVARYGPRSHDGREHEVLFAEVPCRPCSLRDCPSPQCVLGIGVGEVERAVIRATEVPA
ncbi:MAG: lipopolysaccharide heptosyltransferase I [Planctomycetota bacterium]